VAACVGDAEECGDDGAGLAFPVPPGQGATSSAPTITAQPENEAPTTSSTPQAVPSQAVSSIPTETALPSATTAAPTEPEMPNTPAVLGSQTSIAATTPIPIVTLPNSEVVSADPGASTLVIGAQTLTQGSPAITISGGEVVSFAPSGVVVSNTNGEVITHQIPAAPSAISMTAPTQVLGVVAGYTISGGAVGSTAVVLGGQTLSLGGAAVTLSGNQVATLGSSGLVIAVPGGFVTTIAISTPVTKAPATNTMTNETNSSEVHTTFPSTSTVTKATSLGNIILQTLEGDGIKSMDFRIMGWLGLIVTVFSFILGL
jgi:hypothetical protein